MKKNVLILLSLTFQLAQAQVKTPSQPEAGYYEMIKELALNSYLDEKELLVSEPNTLPETFTDTIKKYDWFEIGSYYYYDKNFSSVFGDIAMRETAYANIQINFKRYLSTGVVYEMFLDRRKNGDFAVYTTTFDESTATKLIGTEMINGHSYLVTENYGEKDKQRILSFSNGVMIMEISQNPFGNTDKKFRIAYVAVPRMF